MTQNLDDPFGTAQKQLRIPKPIILGILAICVLPWILNQAGFSFASESQALDPVGFFSSSEGARLDALFYRLSGAFTHTLLEWSAFCVAIFTMTLALIHYRITKDVTTSVISVALCCAGCMDAFHTLAADRLISSTAENNNLVPFTWAICRLFNGLICVAGVAVFFLRPQFARSKQGTRTVVTMSIAFSVIAYATIHYCSTSLTLPQTMFNDSLVTRPWDVAPLIVFIISGIYIFPRFYKQVPSYFAHALVISTIPDIATQVYMAFGSTALFDNNFNIAHGLKIVAYLVPLIGLLLDYVATYRAQTRTHAALKASSQAAKAAQREAENSNRAKTEFLSSMSHELRSPLNSILMLSSALEDNHGEDLSEETVEIASVIHNSGSGLMALINELLDLSRIESGQVELDQQRFPTLNVCKQVTDLFQPQAAAKGITFTTDCAADVPTELFTDERRLCQVLTNLVANAIKFTDKGHVSLKVSVAAALTGTGQSTQCESDQNVQFKVTDTGIGIPTDKIDVIFEAFRQVDASISSQYGGTGLGLPISQDLAQLLGGTLRCESTAGSGSQFTLTVPAHGPSVPTEQPTPSFTSDPL